MSSCNVDCDSGIRVANKTLFYSQVFSDVDCESNCKTPGEIVDFSALTGLAITMYFKKPDDAGTIVEVPLTLPGAFAFTLPDGTATAGDGSDGYVSYLAPSTFLDIPGLWYRQTRIVSNEIEVSTSEHCFRVLENLWT